MKLTRLALVGAIAGGIYWLFKSSGGQRLRDKYMGGGSTTAEDLGDVGDERSEDLRSKIEETRRRLREQVGLPPEG